jgi:hypothetical protein
MSASLQINKNSGFLVNGGEYGAFLTTSMGGDCRFSTIACSAFNRRLHSFEGIVPQDLSILIRRWLFSVGLT